VHNQQKHSKQLSRHAASASTVKSEQALVRILACLLEVPKELGQTLNALLHATVALTVTDE
jgi:hypothetical protein